LSKNAYANVLEQKFELNKASQSRQEEFESIVGRSNSFIYLYTHLCILNKTKPDLQVLKQLENLVYYLQLADDLGDWRTDYMRGHWTPFIHNIHQSQSLKGNASIAEIENIIFTKGIYEEELLKVIKGLSQIVLNLSNRSNEGKKIILNINKKIDLVKQQLIQVTAAKLKYLDGQEL